MVPSPDFFVARSRPNAAVRLLFFPHAGGAPTFFSPWMALLGPDIEGVCVQYPGRGQRFREKSLTSIPEIVDGIVRRFNDMSSKPFAFYGHSMGGLVAFEVARRLRRMGMPTPQHLFVGSSRPPHLGLAFDPIHTLPEAEFIESLQARYGGIPTLIYQDRDILNFFMTAMRADFTAYELHRMEHEDPLPMPITAFAGTADGAVTAASMKEWAIHTDAEFELNVVPGGHFFPLSTIETLIETIRDRVIPRPATPMVRIAVEDTSACT
jgi:medium-chain acyl-[acyl-carrier-protein] hydrolase